MIDIRSLLDLSINQDVEIEIFDCNSGELKYTGTIDDMDSIPEDLLDMEISSFEIDMNKLILNIYKED